MSYDTTTRFLFPVRFEQSELCAGQRRGLARDLFRALQEHDRHVPERIVRLRDAQRPSVTQQSVTQHRRSSLVLRDGQRPGRLRLRVQGDLDSGVVLRSAQRAERPSVRVVGQLVWA